MQRWRHTLDAQGIACHVACDRYNGSESAKCMYVCVWRGGCLENQLTTGHYPHIRFQFKIWMSPILTLFLGKERHLICSQYLKPFRMFRHSRKNAVLVTGIALSFFVSHHSWSCFCCCIYVNYRISKSCRLISRSSSIV